MKKGFICSALVVGAMALLTACGSSLSGTYKTDEVLTAYQTYTFEKDSVTVKTFLAGYKVLEFEGTYEISDDEIILSFEVDQDTGDALTGTQSFEKTESGIKIGTKNLTKQ